MSSPTHLLYPVGLRKGYGTSAVLATSSSLQGLPEVRTKLGRQFWLRLPSYPSLANHLVPLHKDRQQMEVSSGTLAYMLPPFKAHGWIFTSWLSTMPVAPGLKLRYRPTQY